jgi:hypothetical protein
MKILKLFGVAVLVLLLFVLAVFGYYGGFSSVKFSTSVQGGEWLVYEAVRGDYQQAPEVIERVQKAIQAGSSLQPQTAFGTYYDNPQEVATEDLRSEIGWIIGVADSLEMAKLTTLSAVKIGQAPETEYLTATFPWKGELSILVGLVRVYPAMNQYLEENQLVQVGPITEIYDQKNKVILYRTQLQK